MRDHERIELEPIELPKLGPLPGGPVFEWLAEHGARAEQRLLEKRRRIALVLEQSQWLDPLLERIEARINAEIAASGGQRFGRLHLHDRDSKLGRLYSLTPLARHAGVLRRWYLTYTLRIPGAPQRTLPLVIDLLVGGRCLQLCIAPREGLAAEGNGVLYPLQRLYQAYLEGVGIEGAQFQVIVEANGELEDTLHAQIKLAINEFQQDTFGETLYEIALDEGQAATRCQLLNPRQILP